MNSVVAKVVETLKGVVNNYPGTLRNGTTTMFVFALQALISTEGLFNCPFNGHGTYGYMFLFVPALALFLISLILSGSFKKVQGCCYNADATKKKYQLFRFPRWGCSEELFKVFFYSLIASCLWILTALLEKKYYTCAVVGSPDQLKNVTGQNKTDLEERFRDAEKDSQIYGLMLIAVTLGVPLLFLTLRRCCCQRLSSSIPSLSEYEKMEAASAEEVLKEKIKTHATKIGKAKAEKYFSKNFDDMENVYNSIFKDYPRLTGDQGKPYKNRSKETDNPEGIQMTG